MYPLETLCQFTLATKLYECQFGHSLEATRDLYIYIYTHTEHTHSHICVCVSVCAKTKACKTKAFSILTQYDM